MRYIILFMFAAAMAFSFSTRAQTETELRVDSLARALGRAKVAPAKAKILCRLCRELRIAGNTDAALENGKAGLALARRAAAGRSEADCLNEIAGVYWDVGAFDSAASRYEAALHISRETEHARGAARALTGLGNIDSKKGRHSNALARFRRSMALLETTDDYAGQAKAKAGMGAAFYWQGDQARALAYFQDSYQLRLKADDRIGAAAMLNNIGMVYKNLGKLETALEHYEKSLQIKRAAGDLRGVCNLLTNMANVKVAANDFEGALRLLDEAKQIAERKGLSDGIANALNTYGFIYERRNQRDQALACFLEAADIYKQKKELGGLSGAYFNIAESYRYLAQPRLARAYADSAIALGKQSGDLLRHSLGALARSRADAALGDYKSAYEHYKLYKQYNDSLINESQANEIGRLEAKNEFDQQIEARERREAEAARRREFLYWIAAGVFAALLLVAGLLTWGFRTKQKANKQLSAQNAEIKQQSEEISQQRDELQALNEQITEQRDNLEKAHEEITDSIDYASRIQQALLPSVEAMRQNADVYVYYNARDVVSGDFYWTHRIDDDTALYSAADCTGHGVPGAFMSVLGATTLDTIVREYGETSPDKMLGLLDKSIRASLKQDDAKDGSLDGMDLALVKLDKKNRKLFFSSAGRPLFLLRNGEILEYKGAKFPAGGAQHDEKEFPLIEIDLEPGDRIFMCSDGVTDQFGGPRKRKFSPRRLKETLIAHQDKPLQEQGAAFAAAFDDWQQNAKQLDDQLLIGLGA